MNRYLFYTRAAFLCLASMFFWTAHNKAIQKPSVLVEKVTENTIETPEEMPHLSKIPSAPLFKSLAKGTKKGSKSSAPVDKPKKTESGRAANKKLVVGSIALKKVPFTHLPGWDKTDVKKSLSAFQVSCETLLKQEPTHPAGSKHINLKARDWHPACRAAQKINPNSDTEAREFFETWFHPVEFGKKNPIHGLFTGYFMPRLKGSLIKTEQYNTPIYGLPKSAAKRHYTRREIDNGALKKKAPVIAWIESPVERLFMEIEGAGVVQLPDGEIMYLGYAGENGAPYTSIARVLIQKGILTKDNASTHAIKQYLERNPEKAKSILQRNRSFVFFEALKRPIALGAKGMALTPGYSLAIDKKWIPLGAPLWLATTKPDGQADDKKKFQRLMIAQDTGGAINGVMRGDVFWGSGKNAAYLGEHMKNDGRYWLLLPKRAFERLAIPA